MLTEPAVVVGVANIFTTPAFSATRASSLVPAEVELETYSYFKITIICNTFLAKSFSVSVEFFLASSRLEPTHYPRRLTILFYLACW